MTYVFKNYKPTKNKHEELIEVKILEGEDVFYNLPLALVEFGYTPENPIIFGNVQGIPRIQDLKDVLSRTKLFHLKPGDKVEEGSMGVIETNKEEAVYSFRLPIDTPVERLIIMNGQVILTTLNENQENTKEGE